MKKIYLFSALLIYSFLPAQISAVGIGTSYPEQKLHLDNSVGTLRVESLDKNNNEYNGGNIDDQATYPLYVDSNGILTLTPVALENSNGYDAIDDAEIPQSTIRLPPSDSDGKIEGTFFTYSITVPRDAILEIKYSISFEVYQTDLPSPTKIRDGAARRISTYYTLDNLPRKYGQASKCYLNNNQMNPTPYTATDILGAAGQLYNSSTIYVKLTPGPHTINFKAEVSSNLPSMATLVKFAVDTDSVFMRLY